MWMPAVLALAVSTAWADEDEEPWPLPTPKPAAPLLPSLGSYSKVTAGSAVFRGCADYSMAHVWASDPGEPGRKTAVCDDTVYDQETKVFTSTTRGERIGAVASGGNAGFSGSADGWKNASGAGATATANLQKEGHVFNLKVGAQARNGRDVLFSITPTYDPWTAAQNGWREGSSNGAWWLEDGINSQGAGAIARMADRFVVEGTGFVKMTFTVDGLYEKGDSLPFDAGGRQVLFRRGALQPRQPGRVRRRRRHRHRAHVAAGHFWRLCARPRPSRCAVRLSALHLGRGSAWVEGLRGAAIQRAAFGAVA